MEIGSKIKKARTESRMTQEEVAEVLNVSRQTISNWENEKSYPDIVSVIKLSDLFSVTLDHLLKEEPDVKQTYIDYLEESTNTVKSKKMLGKTIIVLTTLFIWAFALITFWVLMEPDDAGAFSLVFLWIILPVTIFTVSLITSKSMYFGKAGISVIPIFGLMYMLSEYATFSAANMFAFGHFNRPSFFMIPVGMVISAVGFGIGTLTRKNK